MQAFSPYWKNSTEGNISSPPHLLAKTIDRETFENWQRIKLLFPSGNNKILLYSLSLKVCSLIQLQLLKKNPMKRMKHINPSVYEQNATDSFCGPALDPLQQIHVFPMLRTPELDAVLQNRVSSEWSRGAQSPS